MKTLLIALLLFNPLLSKASTPNVIGYDEVLEVWLSSSLGIPYIWAGNNPVEGYDCSGFVMEYLRMFGIGPSKDSSSDQIYAYFMKDPAKLVSHFRPGKGSLIFYGRKSPDGKTITRISHIGLMISPFQVAEAGGGNQNTLTPAEAAARNAFVRIRPYLYRADVVFILNPKMPRWVDFTDDLRVGYGVNCEGAGCMHDADFSRFQVPYYY